MKKAFTMIELVFVIVIIGILASVAIPRLAATRDDAEVAKAKATIASVKAALSTERQLRVLRGDFTAITSLNAGGGAFSTFSADGQGVSRKVLESTVPACAGSACWDGAYKYTMPSGIGGTVAFTLNADGTFTCDATDTNCAKLTQ
jgi:general secretion pathway protein G